MSSSLSTSSVVACLTPPGQGALATLGLHGPQSWQAVRTLFRTRAGAELPTTPEVPGFWFGRMGAELADEVVVALKQLEPTPWVEVHAHGGREVVRLLLELLPQQGLTVCPWEAFLQRTEESPLRARATEALTRATTVRTAQVLLDQLHGAFSRALDEILGALQENNQAEGARLLGNLATHAELGKHLTSPWRVVIAGAPNVGKSSLVNALAGYQRSVVSAIPGTTRDVVTTRIAIQGWPVEVADTAGLRTGGEALEAMGINLARSTAEAADLCLWVLDASVEPTWPEDSQNCRATGELAPPAPPRSRVQLVINKVDLPAAWDLHQARDAIHLSAQTGEGLARLCDVMSQRLLPTLPPPGSGVPFTAELVDGVVQAYQLVQQGHIEEARSRLLHCRT